MSSSRNHSADRAEFIAFDTANTRFPSTANTVQKALALTSPTQAATEVAQGVASIATVEEAMAGTNHTKFITPRSLHAKVQRPEATETVRGVAALATLDEAKAGTNTQKIITPRVLSLYQNYIFDTKTATENANGVLKLSTDSAAVAGTDDTTAMTPLKVKRAIATAMAGVVTSVATETNVGLVTLATVGQVNQGVLREGYAISPYTLNMLNASETSKGLAKAATRQELIQGQLDSAYVSAKSFKTFLATDQLPGTVKLSLTKSANAGTALSSNAKVLFTEGNDNTVVAGTVNYTGNLQSRGRRVLVEGEGGSPIGSVIAFAGVRIPNGWMLCDGRSLLKSEYPELYQALGDTYNLNPFQGDNFVLTANHFRIPDLRGEFIRGHDAGRDVDHGRVYGSHQMGTVHGVNSWDTNGAHSLSLWNGVSRWIGGTGREVNEQIQVGTRRVGKWYKGHKHYPIYETGGRYMEYDNNRKCWVGGKRHTDPSKVGQPLTARDFAKLYNGDTVKHGDYDHISVTNAWSSGGAQSDHNTADMWTNDTRHWNFTTGGHFVIASRPRNIAMNYIIKVS